MYLLARVRGASCWLSNVHFVVDSSHLMMCFPMSLLDLAISCLPHRNPTGQRNAHGQPATLGAARAACGGCDCVRTYLRPYNSHVVSHTQETPLAVADFERYLGATPCGTRPSYPAQVIYQILHGFRICVKRCFSVTQSTSRAQRHSPEVVDREHLLLVVPVRSDEMLFVRLVQPLR